MCVSAETYTYMYPVDYLWTHRSGGEAPPNKSTAGGALLTFKVRLQVNVSVCFSDENVGLCVITEQDYKGGEAAAAMFHHSLPLPVACEYPTWASR